MIGRPPRSTLTDPRCPFTKLFRSERLDRLIAAGEMPPVVVAFPDCFTRLGGNQYINSAATGPWEDILLQEVVPLVEQRFGCGGAGRRGVFRKTPGGYGAHAPALKHEIGRAPCRERGGQDV